jgi:predicted Zn-dependent peptidase
MYLKKKNNLIEFQERKIIKDITLVIMMWHELNNEFKDKTSIVILSKIINEDFAYVNFINSMLSLGLKSPLYQEVREKKD